MQSRIKKIVSGVLLAASVGAAITAITAITAYAAGATSELTGNPRQYQRWFEEASAEFNVPVELLQSIAYAETRWLPHVPKGYARNMKEEVLEVESHEGEMPPSYGIMGLRNDGYFGTSLIQAAALIRETPATLLTDTRANIRGAAALLAQYGNRKTRDTPLEQWEDAVAKYSGIPQREVADIHTFDVLAAVHEGRAGERYKIKQRAVDFEKVYGKEKLAKLSAARLIVQFDANGNAVISTPAGQ